MTLLGAGALLGPIREALRGVQADEADGHVHRRHAAISRYSHSSIHQNAVSDETHVRVRAIVGKAVGVVTTNSLRVADVRRALADAAALARASRPDDEWPGVGDPAPIPSSAAFHEETARTDARAQAQAIGATCAAWCRARVTADRDMPKTSRCARTDSFPSAWPRGPRRNARATATAGRCLPATTKRSSKSSPSPRYFASSPSPGLARSP